MAELKLRKEVEEAQALPVAVHGAPRNLPMPPI